MDRKYITLLCESFFNDHLVEKNTKFNKSEIIGEMVDEVTSTMDNLWLEDRNTYDEVYNYNKSYQQQLVYNMLYEYFLEEYNINLHPFSVMIEEMADSGELSIFDEGFGAIAFGAVNALANFLGPFGSAALIIAFIFSCWGVLDRSSWHVMTGIHNITQKIAEIIANVTRGGRVKRLIFVTNLEQCMKTCGITNPTELSRFVGYALTNKMIITDKSKKQALCLSGCYVEWVIKSVEMLASAYARCLRLSGASKDSDISASSIFISTIPSRECSEYFNVLKEHYESFCDVAEVMKRHVDKDSLLNKYNQALDAGLKDGFRQHATSNYNKSYSPKKPGPKPQKDNRRQNDTNSRNGR